LLELAGSLHLSLNTTAKEDIMRFNLPYGLVIETNNLGAGQRVESQLTKELVDEKEPNCVARAGGTVEGIERLLLALACEGVNLSDPKFAAAIETTVVQVANDLY
jgi:hypothetical protein